MIIFNEGNSEERTGIDFGQASFPQDVPVIEMSAEAGAALVEFIEAEAAAGRHGDVDGDHEHRVGGPRVRERDRGDDDRPHRSRGRVRCPPRLGDRGPGHQRQRLRIGGAARGRAADGRAGHRARQPGAVHLVRRRGGRPGGIGLLRQPAHQARDQGHRRDAQLRHGRLAQRGLVRVRRRRLGHRIHRLHRFGRGGGRVRRLLRVDRTRDRADRVRRPLGLRRLRRRRDPGRRSVHRRRGHQDRRAGGQVGRHRRRRVRPVLSPGLRRPSTTSISSRWTR